MMDLQAALALPQLARVETNLLRRQEIWRLYDEAFADCRCSCRRTRRRGRGTRATSTRCSSTSTAPA
jgi:dTDP-4-amino-4,6-dideoxygalactose transaminase